MRGVDRSEDNEFRGQRCRGRLCGSSRAASPRTRGSSLPLAKADWTKHKKEEKIGAFSLG